MGRIPFGRLALEGMGTGRFGVGSTNGELGRIMEKQMETTGIYGSYRGYIGIMAKKMEATI